MTADMSQTVRPALSAQDRRHWSTLPALQQPDWGDRWLLDEVTSDLASLPPLVDPDEVRSLRCLLTEVAAGRLQVVQAGDCAEDPAECVPEVLTRKVALLDLLAGVMRLNADLPVVRVGRLAGQFAKPRSRPTEWHDGRELPVFRGHLVNAPEPDPAARRPDPLRLLTCYHAARGAMAYLRRHRESWTPSADAPLWTSHEALLLDYELPLVRHVAGRTLLTSTHWPWVGERTRQVDGAHVRLLAMVDNPVACKVGPGATPADLVALCGRLDPGREPGRLTLIARMGADRVATVLPPLVDAVRAGGHPVIWLCDPMHGNTVTTRDGWKTRYLDALVREVRDFQDAVSCAGGVDGGLHLETTPFPVRECVWDEREAAALGADYTTCCDPRLNPEQAIAVASAWRAA
ncbi:3-deoxy-D-arabinoheptulosonate-7-phosphate synthase [Streptoalloteichus tenebrarius]|uniref:Phospho-2-dehydro-3-deoxyheptonate aldolase n=1 Tax=Streptoalloteichus tenebrarius (strain ATCC 17920 / DSM 40477 / JCM 4838 / CBS 697.72 / NBRC 16177 / NCIMB 11028 / NRRL B-12390 / A12253. 1 / ISP 5477) TaxID=1933 RepID=A0ABT1HWY6_STRSD|nr:3-deoxy-7-phosphoheptulonate synthase [Streptoalloteichus tenebrarius]MCP2260036.1 3-deoxy-D-arabinoheptulosonate-7-phosphate synthase [Streptoalloteichus tenebrarius]BFF03847.1 3-deoxy-7-phosphoheptulonate synthase [Streptoalloteichus tenebrarius]